MMFLAMQAVQPVVAAITKAQAAIPMRDPCMILTLAATFKDCGIAGSAVCCDGYHNSPGGHSSKGAVCCE